jgi:CheY-like chemotaxis protein
MSDSPNRAESAQASNGADGAPPTLLLVDDDPDVRAFAAETLRLHGYRVIEKADGLAALAYLRDQPDVDLVVVDYAMPLMSGAEFAERVDAARPALPLLFVTAFAEFDLLAALSAKYPMLKKPFRRQDLTAAVQRALAQGHHNGMERTARSGG